MHVLGFLKSDAYDVPVILTWFFILFYAYKFQGNILMTILVWFH